MHIHKLKTSTAAKSLNGIWMVSLASFVIATLHFARDLLIPITLAVLLTFLLAPLVTRLEKWLGRILAVLLVMGLIFGATGSAGWVLTQQIVDLATKLPDYKENIQNKLRAFKLPTGPRFKKFTETLDELKNDLPGGTSPETKPVPERAGPVAPSAQFLQPAIPGPVIAPPASIANPFEIAHIMLAPMLGPLGMGALVLLLVVFMLLKREDLRSRLIWLVGQSRISTTTRAMDEAGSRVTRYLQMLLVVNMTYGMAVAIGLYFLDVPNAVLWGTVAAVLRFIPYVGPWIGAVIPVALSLAVSPGWSMPLTTIGLFVTLELLSNNVMEPWLYSSSTGVSSIALIFAAVFWTGLWGPVGLVLATPLTVCLVVMGRHISRLSFLSVMLSDEQALTPAQDCYYRLLSIGDHAEMELVENYLKTNSLTGLYDSVIIPVLTAVENDHRLELLDDGQHALIQQNLRDIVEDLGARSPVTSEVVQNSAGAISLGASTCRVSCVPARAERDDLAGAMLAQLLNQQGFDAQCVPTNLTVRELIGQLEHSNVEVVCISVVAPSTVLNARYLCMKLNALLPTRKILVGLWGATDTFPEDARRVRDTGANEVVTTFADAVIQINAWARSDIERVIPT